MNEHGLDYVRYPEYPDSKYGTSGQSLRTKGDGTTEWADVGLPTDAQTATAVTAWLNAHPEATTTVPDGSISKAKLATALADQIDEKSVMLSYYDEISYSVDKVEGIDVYAAEVPLYDSNFSVIPVYVGYSATLSPLEYARENGTTLTTNNCISMKPEDGTSNLTGNIISEGVVLNSQDITKELVSKGIGYLTISQDRLTIKDYPITTTLATLEADTDVYNCMTYYCRLVEDSELLDISGIVSNEGKEFATNTNGVGMFFGVKADKTIIIVGNDGRTDLNVGILPTTIAEWMVEEKNCTDVWLMDGGGSSNITIRGSKLNRNYDASGTADRKIKYTFNVRKPTCLKSTTDVFAKIGEEKQNLIKQLFPAIEFESDRFETESGVDLNAISKTSAKYIIHATNYPGSSDIGYFFTIVRNSTDGYLGNKIQYWTHYGEAFGLFVRKYYGGAWSSWKRFMPALYDGDEIATNISFYIGCTDGDKIYLTIPCGELYKTGNSTGTWGNDREDTGLIVFMNGSRIVFSKPTIGFVRPQAHIGFYVRFDNLGTALTGDSNYADKAIVGVSVRDLHITI